MGLRLPELLVILVIVVLIFGAGKLPQLGDAIGRGIRNFKKAANGDEVKADETRVEKKAD
jgi:sec-independent protein translocase protein TatA